MELDITAQNSAYRLRDVFPFEILNLKRRIVS